MTPLELQLLDELRWAGGDGRLSARLAGTGSAANEAFLAAVASLCDRGYMVLLSTVPPRPVPAGAEGGHARTVVRCLLTDSGWLALQATLAVGR